MRKTIWKYELTGDHHTISMPAGSEVLTLDTQSGGIYMWVLVDPETVPQVTRNFRTYGTGQPLPDEPGTYIGTFFLAGGSLVFHVFEEETK